MFELIHISGPHGDCCSNYDVKMDKPYTVREFINEVLISHSGEWGDIRIKAGNIEYRDEVVCEYDHGKIKTLNEKYLDRIVLGGTANGGLSAMGYCLRVVDDYFTKHYLIMDGKITKAAVILGPSKDVKISNNNNGGIVRRLSEQPKVMFNGPATIFQYGDFKTVVKCNEEDKFDRLVGLGVALYRYYRQHKDNKKGNLAKELVKYGEGTWIELDI